MALRNIRILGDEILKKQAKEVTEMTPKIEELIDDMFETMYDANGCGLAAPQVGIRKRIVVIDCGDQPLVLINPEILETSGEQTGQEGCLSVPGKVGIVTRPNYAKVKALDENMDEIIVEGTELLARCLCHEIDHLNGIMYVDKAEGYRGGRRKLMKVVFMGTPDFSVGTLKAIVEAGHEVAAVVTQPDKPKGRGGAMSFSDVKQAAIELGLLVLQPKRARDEEFVNELRKINPDVIVVVAFGQILSKEILDMPKYGCVNVHASLLPKYRGASPIQWAVIDGCEYSGVTTMMMNEGIDTGDILLVEKVKLDSKETGGSLFDKLSGVGAALLVKTLDELEKGTVKPVKQNETEATHVKMLDKSFGNIDFSMEAARIERLIRGLNPWPSAFTHFNGKLLKIWDADVCDDVVCESCESVVNGMITHVDNNSFIVKCGDNSLKINELQLEGKKRMKTQDFLRGNHINTGDILGK